MTVTSIEWAPRWIALTMAAMLALVACGPDTPGEAGRSATSPETAPSSHTPTTGETSTTMSVEQPADVPLLHVAAGLGYPRDLLDRGRVNIRINRADDVEFVLLDKQLVARHFTPPPPEARRTVIPPNGQVVAVQTLFGEVSDCDDPSPVEAELVVSYTLGDDPVVRQTSLAVDDATTLDDIRVQVCTQRRVIDGNDFELLVDDVDGETMAAHLVVRRRAGTDRLAFDAIKGTVLFGAEAAALAGSPERVLDGDEDETSIAITFTVNRCDPHAVGETTRKYGLDVYIAVDDVEAQRIDVPIDALVPRFDEMLERCKERTGQ